MSKNAMIVTPLNTIFRRFAEADNFSWLPSFIGFDDIFEDLEKIRNEMGQSFNSFPPYDLRQDGNNYVLEVAVAGYDKKDLSVTLDNGVLEIKAMKNAKVLPTGTGKTDVIEEIVENWEEKKNYLHKGIAKRTFNLKYTLSDETIIKDAKLENGMLTLTMEKIVPEKKEVKQIEIK